MVEVSISMKGYGQEEKEVGEEEKEAGLRDMD